MRDILELLHERGVIDALDLEFALLMAELAQDSSRELLLGCALVSRAVHSGDVCLELVRHAGQLLLKAGEEHAAVFLPPLERWRQALRCSPVVGWPNDFKPLILDAADRLYLYRYWDYETQLAADLKARVERLWPVDEQRLAQGLLRLFPAQARPDWQKIAAALTVLRGFCVISGGPGTGKTTTLARILALLIEQAATPPRIRLAAPTGKAATRMQEAIRASKARLADTLDAAVLEAIPEEASTLHRLLGPKSDGVYFHHNRDNPLSLDVLVIDEASMVDLALLTKTVWALPAQARLILLGDKDQLSSVEAGAVLGELCGQAGHYSPEFAATLHRLTGEDIPVDKSATHALQNAVALLSHSYRFGAESGIGQLAGAINRADTAELGSLGAASLPGVHWHAPRRGRAVDELMERMLAGYEGYLECVRRQAAAEAIIAAFGDFRVLCPLRGGEFGVEGLNAWFENVLKIRLHRPDREWYPGRPIMIGRNDYQLDLFNGDIGIVLPDPQEPDQLRAYFERSTGGLRSVALTRLPAYEPVFAMTIHKSQGSEFERVLLVLPAEDSPVLTRELVYTGVSRAKTQLDIWGSLDSLQRTVQKSVRRASGLGDALWERVAYKPSPGL